MIGTGSNKQFGQVLPLTRSRTLGGILLPSEEIFNIILSLLSVVQRIEQHKTGGVERITKVNDDLKSVLNSEVIIQFDSN